MLLNEEDIDTSLKGASFEPVAAQIMINYVSHIWTDPPWGISVRILSGSLYLSVIFATSKVREGKLCWRNCYPLSASCPVDEDWAWNTKWRIQLRMQYFKYITGLNRFLSDLSRHICEQISFICPRNFTAISWGVDLKEKLFLAKTSRSGVTNQSRLSGYDHFTNQMTLQQKKYKHGINGQYRFRWLRNNLKMEKS